MQDDDRNPKPPPEDLERTVIMPTPGGRRRATDETIIAKGPSVDPTSDLAPSPAAGPAISPAPLDPTNLLVEGASRNTLLRAAVTCFALVRHIRKLQHHHDVPGLRQRVLQTVKAFEAKARELGASPEAAYAGRYALCALIDEIVLATPWGSDSLWREQSLLATLHNETRGGEKFFRILARMAEDPARNIDLLELLYVCLCLGFRGMYGVMERGQAELDEIERGLYRTMRTQRGAGETELSPRWRGVSTRGAAVARFLPLWVVPVLVCSGAVLLFMGLSYSLNRASDGAFARLNQIGRGAAARQAVAAPAIPPAPPVVVGAREPSQPGTAQRIRSLLQDEVERDVIEVVDEGRGATILIHNRGLFASGSARVSQSHRPLLAKLGAVLNDRPGPILVIGHTDSQPIRTLQFPSNWHLSAARAKAVAAVLAEAMGDPGRLLAEGRADTEPVAGNETAAGREANRRIEIKISGS